MAHKKQSLAPLFGRHRRMQMRLLAASLSLSTLASVSHAQALEEVVVTAQKREQSVQDVGIAMSVFSSQQLTDMQVVESTDITAMTPGLYVGGSVGGQFRQFSIRGVTQNDISDTTEPPNAVYIDEAYMPAAQAHAFAAFDLDRVEVLKGPQGTLFGRNATGGLVHYITKKPTEKFEGFGDVTYGSYDQVRFEGAVSGPLTQGLMFRLSGLFNRHDEIFNNLYPFGQPNDPLTGQPMPGSPSGASDYWNDDQWALRGQILWRPRDDIEFLMSGFVAEATLSSTGASSSIATTPVRDALGRQVNTIFSRNDPQGCEQISAETGGCLPVSFLDGEIPGVNDDALRPVVGGDFFGYIDPDGDGLDVSADHALTDSNYYKTKGVTANLKWDVGATTLTAISHYTDSYKFQALETDTTPAPVALATPGPIDAGSFTQELRANGVTERMDWVAGLYYLRHEVDFNSGFDFGPGAPVTTIFFGGLPIDTIVLADFETKSSSAFGHLEYELSDRFSVIAGLRVIEEKQEYGYRNILTVNTDDAKLDYTGTPLNIGLEFPSFSDERSKELWTGKLQLNYKPTADWLVYAGINRGVKAGNFNAQQNDLASPPLSADEIPYDEEVLLAYEGGFKSTLAGGRAEINGSFYYYDYKDYHAFTWTNFSGTITNRDAEYKGGELTLQAAPFDNFNVSFGVSYIDAVVKSVEIAPGVFRDVEPTFTPDLQLSGMVSYTWPNSLAGGSMELQLDGNYAASAYHNLRNFEAHKMPSYVLGNARLMWNSADENWQATLFVNNIADERYQPTGFDLSTLCGCNSITFGKPRWYGIRLRYSYR